MTVEREAAGVRDEPREWGPGKEPAALPSPQSDWIAVAKAGIAAADQDNPHKRDNRHSSPDPGSVPIHSPNWRKQSLRWLAEVPRRQWRRGECAYQSSLIMVLSVGIESLAHPKRDFGQKRSLCQLRPFCASIRLGRLGRRSSPPFKPLPASPQARLSWEIRPI